MSDSPTIVLRVDVPVMTGAIAGATAASAKASRATAGWVPPSGMPKAGTGFQSDPPNRRDATAGTPERRIDPSHASATAEASPSAEVESETTPYFRESWLQLHATELIRRLQLWAAGLDAREANLNAASARQDIRERKFRVQQLEFQAEMAEAQRAADEVGKQIAAQSRRLVFQSMS